MGNELQVELSKQAARVWNAMPDDEKRVYQEAARREQIMHRIQYPDYQYSPGTCCRAKRTKKTTRAVDDVSARAQPLPPNPGPGPAIVPSVPQLCLGDVNSMGDQPAFSIDALPHSLTFGADTYMFNYGAETTGYASTAYPGLSPPLHYTYTDNYAGADLHAAVNDVSNALPAVFDYGLETFDLPIETYLYNQPLPYN